MLGLRRGSRWWLAPAGMAVVLVAAGTWVTIRAVQVQGDLERARGHLTAIEWDIEGLGAAGRQLEAAGAQTASARDRTGDPLWRALERLPIVGDDLAAVRLTATSVDIATRDVAIPLVQVAQALDPDSLQRPDGSIDIAPIGKASPVLDDAEAQASLARATLGAARADGLLPPVAAAVDQASASLDDLASATARLARAGRLVPPMLGATEPRRYFLAFQNPAEARGTGGIVGTYGVLEVDGGRIELVTVGSNDDLPSLPEPPADLGAEYDQLYGDLPSDLRNANLSPHFPYAGEQLLAQWRQRSGEQLDGVVAVDPVVLGLLLETAGPVELSSGEVVQGQDLVDLTLRDVYERFDEDGAGRRGFLAELVKETFEQITGTLDPLELVEVLDEPQSQRRLLVYSTRDAEQRELEMTPFGGALPPADGSTRGVVVNNAAANKLDYYLEREVVYEVGCTDEGRTSSTLHVTLRNTAPQQGLPEYVYSHLAALEAQPSTNRLIVSAFVPAQSGLDAVTVDGVPTAFSSGSQLGYDVRSVTVDVPAGAEVELVWQLDEPAVPEKVTLLEQPIVRSADLSVVRRCSPG